MRPHTRRSLTRAAAAAAAATAAASGAPVLPHAAGGASAGVAEAASPAAPAPAPPAPAGQRGARSRRPARDVTADLRARLAAYEDSRRRAGPGQGSGRHLLAELDRVSKEALADLESQVHGGTSPIYWAASIIRDAVAANDEPALDRAARYLDAAQRPAG